MPNTVKLKPANQKVVFVFEKCQMWKIFAHQLKHKLIVLTKLARHGFDEIKKKKKINGFWPFWKFIWNMKMTTWCGPATSFFIMNCKQARHANFEFNLIFYFVSLTYLNGHLFPIKLCNCTTEDFPEHQETTKCPNTMHIIRIDAIYVYTPFTIYTHVENLYHPVCLCCECVCVCI